MSEKAQQIAAILYNDSFFQQCVKIIESNVLTREIVFKPRGTEPSDRFSVFIRTHYDQFVRQALRHIYAYGFVAWRIRKLASGDLVPEALPMASFSWAVVPNKEKDEKLLKYEITHCLCNVELKNINVIVITPPIYEARSGSNSPSTPFDSVLEHYKRYKKAEENALTCDEWNSRAQIAHVHNSSQNNNMNERLVTNWIDDAQRNRHLIETGMLYHNCNYNSNTNECNDNDKIRYKKLRDAMEHQMIDHTQINWFPLTDDSQLKQMENLKLNTDFERMFLLYKESVCHAMGIPTQLIIQNTFTSNTAEGGYNTSSRLFNNTMRNLSRQLSFCLQTVYEKIYKEPCVFELSPLTRLEITSYDTVQKLLEMENGIHPDTRKALLKDIHFQITGETQRCVAYLEHAHTV